MPALVMGMVMADSKIISLQSSPLLIRQPLVRIPLCLEMLVVTMLPSQLMAMALVPKVKIRHFLYQREFVRLRPSGHVTSSREEPR